MAVGSRVARILLWVGVGLALLPLPALAQTAVRDWRIPQPVSLYDEDLLAVTGWGAGEGFLQNPLPGFLPRYAERPIDDLSPRPGALASSMGGAHLALAEGAFALGWNPAGLAGLDRTSLCIDGVVRSSSGTGSHLPAYVVIPDRGVFVPSSYSVGLSGGRAFEFAGLAAPLLRVGPRPVVGGIAFRRHTEVAFGQATVLEMNYLGAVGDTYPFVLGEDNQERGSIQSLTCGLAYQADLPAGATLALGGTANFLTGRLRSSVEMRAAVRDFEEGFVRFQRDYKGFSIEGGGLAKALDGRVRVGGWVGLPHSIRASNMHLEGQALVLPTDLVVDRWSVDFADYDMDLPLFAGGGVALGPFYGVQVALDANYRPWSEMWIRHTLPEYARYDRKGTAADVTSYHVGGRFEFPLLRGLLHRRGMRLDTQLGYRTMPLSMRDRDLLNGEPPLHAGEPVEGYATSVGLSYRTGTEITFHLSMELQSYQYSAWFLDDQRSVAYDPTTYEPTFRELGLTDPYDAVTRIDQRNTVFRLSAEMRP